MNNIPWNWWLEGEISFFDWPNFRGYVREGIAFKLCRLATKPCTACRVWAKQKRKGSMEAVCSSAHEEVVWFDHWTDVDIYKYWSFKVKKTFRIPDMFTLCTKYKMYGKFDLCLLWHSPFTLQLDGVSFSDRSTCENQQFFFRLTQLVYSKWHLVSHKSTESTMFVTQCNTCRYTIHLCFSTVRT